MLWLEQLWFLWFFPYPADHVPDWQPRILLGMIEARSAVPSVEGDTSLASRARMKDYKCLSCWNNDICEPVASVAQLVTSQPSDTLGREFESQ